MMFLLKIENVKKKKAKKMDFNIGTLFTYNADATPAVKKPTWCCLTRFFLIASTCGG